METKSTLEESIANMEKVVSRSNALWLQVNRYILSVLKSGKTREEMVAALNNAAGPEKKNEPVSLCSLRTAAKQIENGELVDVI
jgi:hypothetical protein